MVDDFDFVEATFFLLPAGETVVVIVSVIVVVFITLDFSAGVFGISAGVSSLKGFLVAFAEVSAGVASVVLEISSGGVDDWTVLCADFLRPAGVNCSAGLLAIDEVSAGDSATDGEVADGILASEAAVV